MRARVYLNPGLREVVFPDFSFAIHSSMLRQREEWIRFSYSNEDTKDEEKKGWGRRGTTKCGAKRQAHTCPRATPAYIRDYFSNNHTCA
jgi:hypothetical protein